MQRTVVNQSQQGGGGEGAVDFIARKKMTFWYAGILHTKPLCGRQGKLHTWTKRGHVCLHPAGHQAIMIKFFPVSCSLPPFTPA
mmetsp:Transcript_44793/g.65763  ORF Transcript_44793/g.65763 Transcript_44793/m.65763 type:complete len:84 (+) Transcript_44793:205-456(+)